MNAVLSPNALRIPSFWWLQTAGWCCFCLLCALVVFPYVRQPGELGYQSSGALFADQGLLCLVGFLASLMLRPVCRSLLQRPLSWITLEVRAASWSLAIGTSAAFIASRIIISRLELIELLEACAKASALLFLWCNLYFGIKQSQRNGQEPERHARAEDEGRALNTGKYASRFTVRTGSRIQVVSAEDLEWVAAAGDYTELHTRNGAHLLRETMNSLEQTLDPARFARIHRSRIVSLVHILELRAIENREYVVKLSDGSQHRSSRTYADRIDRWLRRES
jgi:DNA-binding LytR/AlgR family response regulator